MGTGEWEEVPEEDIVSRVGNTIIFKVDHFSTYGAGVKGLPLPFDRWAIPMVLLVLFGLSGIFAIRSRLYSR